MDEPDNPKIKKIPSDKLRRIEKVANGIFDKTSDWKPRRRKKTEFQNDKNINHAKLEEFRKKSIYGTN